VEQLILEGYLQVGAYQVLKMGDIKRLKNPENRVLVKITDEDKRPAVNTKTEKRPVGISSLTSSGFKLFDKLRELRLEIAREENMPPYIIFNDKTLIEMAVKVPVNQWEMLGVSGVGNNKYMKYGERFLEVIREFTDIYPDLLTDRVSPEQETTVSVSKVRKKEVKQEFSLFPEEAENYNYDGYKTVSEIRDEMNRICERENVKKLTATRLTEILLEEGIISGDFESDDTYSKIPTEKGKNLGVIVEDRISQKGNEYHVLKYSPDIQSILVQHYVELPGILSHTNL
jgi:ATP-dependent DNA helicase RecQ